MLAIGVAARSAAQVMGGSPPAARDAALAAVAAHLRARAADIDAANVGDVAAAAGDASLGPAVVKRLELGASKLAGVIAGVDDVRALPDPLGSVTLARELSPGLELRRRTCPIGVLCVIFEARPEAVVQIASLAIKSGNAVVLKGGREAQRSNAALVEAIRAALASLPPEHAAFVPVDAVQLVSTREDVAGLLQLDEHIDVRGPAPSSPAVPGRECCRVVWCGPTRSPHPTPHLPTPPSPPQLVIPRGSKELVRSIKAATRIPVMGHADGVCHVYVDASADLAKAVPLVVDSKTQYPAACNAAETLLVAEAVVHTVSWVMMVVVGGWVGCCS